MKHIYIFSGLGADKRLFQKIDFSGFNIIHVDWIPPLENESLEIYAQRIMKEIKHERPILIGLSFGGFIVCEIAKVLETEKVILLATAQTYRNLPFYYRAAGFLRLHKVVPLRLLKHPSFITYWFFGTETRENKRLLKQVLEDIDLQFLKWAIDKVLSWKNSVKNKNAVHIHGTKDRILPIKFVHPDIIVKGGGHVMTLTKANELTKLIREELAKA
jgi:pimeloyl-ACP methyl ester carboxylesterase